jgi:DNA-binding transcriptional MerR regulator
MRSYTVRDVERLLRLPPDTTRNLVRAGFVKPARGARREYRFSFQDLIVLRTARALLDARIPARRIRRSLASLRRELPQSLPLSGLSISAVGDHVVVRDGDAQRHVESGQYLLGLDVRLENGMLHVVEHRQAAPPATGDGAARTREDWFALTAMRSTRIRTTLRPGPTGGGSCMRSVERSRRRRSTGVRSPRPARTRCCFSTRGCCSRIWASQRMRSRRTGRRSPPTPISPTAITTSHGSTNRSASRNMPFAISGATAGC